VFVFGTFAFCKEVLDFAIFIIQKTLSNYLGSVVFRILVEKCNIYEAHIFPRSLVQTC